ncbi:putative DNA binding domain-containing protein [Mesorhizobium sp. B292B1B]|uniref:ATP-binding protein n=1 Tax=unclassified Mesorhizobium TaxID=325217 RepID=UPI001126C5A8|nr:MULTISPECIES: ATP-binding protein [unclassified Mesorhizobium]MCA0014173.1 putative DNA binding domain-containing protein [Mesorhizobium sp. B294B1A1]MCA0038593.1 putative DNA binding domain-containing protein [Mesorhizobium sp. B292B1B]TPM47899.1 hypothetical protein FJ964_10115 [Mesorhizobium sp. B2-3-2]
MQSDQLIDLIQDLRDMPAENGFCEFKENSDHAEQIGALVSALSNAACLEGEAHAYIVWGIRDGTHDLVGTTFDQRGKVPGGSNQEMELWLSQMLQPSIHLKFFEAKIDGFRVVLLRIPAASSITTKFKHIAYIRIGSATPKLSSFPEREAALTAALRPFVWEKGNALTGLSDYHVLDLIDYQSYFELLRQKQPDSPVDVLNKLRTDRIITREGTRFDVTNFGAVLFARKLENFEPVARKLVRVIQYEGKSRTVTVKEQPGGRGYASGFKGLIKYIMSVLPQSERIEGAFRHVRESYGEEMIREAVANALIHQDFAITGTGPMVEIFKDRIEISNPGRPLIDPQRFIDFPPRSRNELLAGMMRRAFICEERGSGIDKVVLSAEKLILPAPDFRTDGDNHRTILYGPRPFRDTTPNERVRACYHHAVIAYMKGDRMTNASLRMRLGIDDKNASQVSRVLNQALEERQIKAADSWSTRAGTYVPIWA